MILQANATLAAELIGVLLTVAVPEEARAQGGVAVQPPPAREYLALALDYVEDGA